MADHEETSVTCDEIGELSGADALLEAITRCAADKTCTDVLVNGTQMWVDRGNGLERKKLSPGVTRDQVRALAVRLAAQAERRLDPACPIVDARMPQGWRLHAVIPPISGQETLLSIRIPRLGRMTLGDFIRFGWEPVIIECIAGLVRSRANVVVSGGTGSGKTTLLVAALGEVDANERLVCIEEIPEIFPRHPHCVHMYERAPNIQGKGAVSLSELVRAAMRMRPDRLVLGECRGVEVRDVMTALNTGHEGGWVTLHANSGADVPTRLLALGSLAGMSPQAVNAQAGAAFDAVVHMGRGRDGVRQVDSIHMMRVVEGELLCVPAVQRGPDGSVCRGQAWQDFCQRVGLSGWGDGR